jgi:hypothetical protein
MKMRNMRAAVVLACFVAPAALADHAYVDFDDVGNMVISGPFDAVIPLPEGARIGAPEHSSPSFLNENLKVSKAGYFADDRFVMVQVETTDAAAGTLTNENLPVYKIGDSDFRARTACIDISQEDLDSDDDPLFEFIEGQNVQIVPAVQAVQLSVIADDGTAEGTILYMRNVAGGCAAMTEKFEDEFAASFERFIESINSAN